MMIQGQFKQLNDYYLILKICLIKFSKTFTLGEKSHSINCKLPLACESCFSIPNYIMFDKTTFQEKENRLSPAMYEEVWQKMCLLLIFVSLIRLSWSSSHLTIMFKAFHPDVCPGQNHDTSSETIVAWLRWKTSPTKCRKCFQSGQASL